MSSIKTVIKEKVGEILSSVGEALTEQAHRDVENRQMSAAVPTQTDYQSTASLDMFDESDDTGLNSDVRDRTSDSTHSG